jgi:hypothetical protein
MVRERRSPQVGSPKGAGPARSASTRFAPKFSGVSLVVVLLLSACASGAGERVAGSAAVGGALGIPAGPIGIAVGAGVGAAAGALAPKTVLEGSSEESGR